MRGASPLRLSKALMKFVRRILSPDFLKFCIVGGSGVIVNFAFFIFFLEYLGVHHMISGAIATELAILNNFILNDLWTFRGRRRRPLRLRILLFHASRALGMVVTLATLYLAADVLGLDKILSYVLAIGAGLVANFYTSDVYVWQA